MGQVNICLCFQCFADTRFVYLSHIGYENSHIGLSFVVVGLILRLGLHEIG